MIYTDYNQYRSEYCMGKCYFYVRVSIDNRGAWNMSWVRYRFKRSSNIDEVKEFLTKKMTLDNNSPRERIIFRCTHGDNYLDGSDYNKLKAIYDKIITLKKINRDDL